MRKLKNKLLTSLVIVSLIISAVPFNAFASEVPAIEAYVSKELGVTFERIVEPDKVKVDLNEVA